MIETRLKNVAIFFQKIFMCEINITIVLIYHKLGLVVSVEQKIKLPSAKKRY